MSERETLNPQHDKADWRGLLIVGLLPCSLVAFVASCETLTAGPFPVGWNLYLWYFGYSVSLLILLHTFVFFVSRLLQDRGKRLDKRIPKYLEYAYAIVISASLTQVFFSTPRLADYLVFVTGDEQALLGRIREHALDHVRKDCRHVDLVYFTKSYCEKMGEIVNAANLKGLLLENLVNDPDFLYHPIGQEFVPTPPAASLVDKYSPMLRDVLNLEALENYREETVNSSVDNVIQWVAIMLLPLGIGLRVLKTSLELFVEMA